MDFVTVTDLACRPTEAVLGFEQHGFGVPVLRVRCDPALDEPVYFPPCTADSDRSAELAPKPGARGPSGRMADPRGADRGDPHLPALLG
jgi:hypothetical protein